MGRAWGPGKWANHKFGEKAKLSWGGKYLSIGERDGRA